MAVTPSEVAWVAGLFEGEGTLYSYREKRGGRLMYWHLNIRMTDEDVIRKAHELTGVGTFSRIDKPYQRSIKLLYKWSVTSRLQLAALLPQLLPHMGERRAAKMRECLAWCQEERPQRGPTRGTPWSPARRAAEDRRKLKSSTRL